jgi:hypothetical protein
LLSLFRGRYLAVAAREPVFHVWDTDSGQCIASGGASNSAVKKPWVQLAWKTSSSLLVSGVDGVPLAEWQLELKPGGGDPGVVAGVTKRDKWPIVHSGIVMNACAVFGSSYAVTLGQDRCGGGQTIFFLPFFLSFPPVVTTCVAFWS